MVQWFDVDKSLIEFVPTNKDRNKFRYQGGPFRFQVPRARCIWGVSQYKSMNIEIRNREFITWWRALEAHLCPQDQFNTNLKDGSLRLKVDDAIYVFDENSKQVCPEVKEGLFRGVDVQCIIDIDSTYFYNGNWGLTVRIYQIKTYGTPDEPIVTGADETVQISGLTKGVCAFSEDYTPI